MQRKESIFLHLRFGKSASVRIAYFRICNSPFLVQNGHRKQLFGGLIIIKISSDEPSGARGSLRARVRSASHCCAAGQRVRLHGGRHTALTTQLQTNSTTQKRPRAWGAKKESPAHSQLRQDPRRSHLCARTRPPRNAQARRGRSGCARDKGRARAARRASAARTATIQVRNRGRGRRRRACERRTCAATARCGRGRRARKEHGAGAAVAGGARAAAPGGSSVDVAVGHGGSASEKEERRPAAAAGARSVRGARVVAARVRAARPTRVAEAGWRLLLLAAAEDQRRWEGEAGSRLSALGGVRGERADSP